MADNELQIDIIAVDSISNILEKIAGNFGVLGGIATAAVGAAAGAFGALIGAGASAEDVQAKFVATLATSPLKDFQSQLEALASSYSKVTRFEDETIVSAETVLLRYQNLGQDVMPLAVKTTLNLATVMGTDATSAAQQLGKALEDIAGGSLSLLGRTRLLTKEEVEHAKALAAGGDAAGAQAYVLGILDKQIGNMATSMGMTLAGRMEIFRNTLQNIAEDMGMKLLPALEPLITKLTDLAIRIAPVLTSALQTSVIPAFVSIVQWVSNAGNAFRNLSSWWAENSPAIIAAVKPVWDAIVTGAGVIWAQIQTLLIPVLQEFGKHFKSLGGGGDIDIIKIVQGIAWVFANVLVPAITVAVSIVVDVLSVLLGVVNTLTDAFQALAGWFNQTQGMHLGGGPGGWGWQPNAGHRASGGPVSAGGLYLVGEQGPELFSPSTNGTIIPSGGGSGSVTLNVHVSGAYDPQQAARDMKPALRYALRELGVATNG